MKRFIAVALCLAGSAVHAERAFELIQRREFRVLYHQAIGPLKQEKWIAQLPGPAGEGSRQMIEGVEYLFADSCKPHDCADENLLLAYGRHARRVYVMVRTQGEVRLLGHPPPSVSLALERAYAQRFKP